MSSSSRPRDTNNKLKMKMQTSGKKQTGEKSIVSKKKTRKRKKSNLGCSKKRVLTSKSQIDSCSSDDEGFVCLGEKKDLNASILSGTIFRNTSSSSSSSSSSSDDDIVLGGETSVKNGSFSKNVRNLRPNLVRRNDNSVGVKGISYVDGSAVVSVSEDSDEEGGFEVVGEKMVKRVTFSENVVSRDENTEPINSLGIKSVLSVDGCVENVGEESDESTDKSVDSIYELETSCEEEDMDDSDNENGVGLDRTLIKYKGFSGMDVMVNFEDSGEEEKRTSKSQKRSECKARKADKGNSSRGECSKKKKRSFEEEVGKEQKSTACTARNAELIRDLLNAVNEEMNVEENGLVREPLPSKFTFEDEVKEPTQEQTEWDKEVESLFLKLNYCLRMIEIESANLSKTENEYRASKEVGECPAASCTHDPVLDEQIGGVCRLCGVILLERKDILPPWCTLRSKQEGKYSGELQNPVNDELQSHNSVKDPNESMRVQGTVWDLIPGFQKDLYPHQREGFEFLWKNIAGDIAMQKLPESLAGKGRGCIMSHVPGTGKTRLTVVFLLSFLKRYPKARPVILATQATLSTWENELAESKVDVSFHNMNNPKLSGNETRFGGGTKRLGVRLAKLLSWIEGGGILGISYTLFGTLASKGEKGGDDEAIWEALVKMPKILVLDEGHVPRNDNGFIGNAIKKVKTKRCIMLSGTPFQNNFEELKTTLGLVDPNFHKMDKNSWAKLTEGKDELEKLRSRLDPYVHYYMGSLLEKSLPGLKDTMIFLRPSELQKKLMDACEKMEVFLALTYSVSLISVHPSALMVHKKGKFVKSPDFSSFKGKLEEIKSDYDEGVKIKFVMNLIQLADALGERVLVFSHFTYPLMFIKKQLETHFSWKEGSEVLYMDGKLEDKHRQQSMSSFNNSSSKAKVLLASLKACSEGINLVGASRVILLTTAWNPSVERQAISRAYRLGQKKVVHVYRLITSGMEVRQYELQAKKDQISQLIFSPVDEKAGDCEKSSEIFEEDNILEQMQNLESFKNSFEKIIHQPKESDFLENFKFKDL